MANMDVDGTPLQTDAVPKVNQFPCLFPMNPHMSKIGHHLKTFKDSPNWSSDRVVGTPYELASAGMYYLGERDRVKCWYCNGGFQNLGTGRPALGVTFKLVSTV